MTSFSDNRRFLLPFLGFFAVIMVGGTLAVLAVFQFVLPDRVSYRPPETVSFDESISIHPLEDLLESAPEVSLPDENTIRIDNSGDVVYFPTEMDDETEPESGILTLTRSRPLHVIALAKIPMTPVELIFSEGTENKEARLVLDATLSRKMNYIAFRTMKTSLATHTISIDANRNASPPVIHLPPGQYRLTWLEEEFENPTIEMSQLVVVPVSTEPVEIQLGIHFPDTP